MVRQIGRIILLDDAGIGELDHLLGIVEEEDRVILHDQIGGVAGLAQRLLTGHAEQFDADAERRAEIGIGRRGVAGEAHPGGEPVMREDADPPGLGHVRQSLEPGVGDAVQLAEDGALGRALSVADAFALGDVDEHLDKALGRLVGLVETGRNREIAVFAHTFPLSARFAVGEILSVASPAGANRKTGESKSPVPVPPF